MIVIAHLSGSMSIRNLGPKQFRIVKEGLQHLCDGKTDGSTFVTLLTSDQATYGTDGIGRVLDAMVKSIYSTLWSLQETNHEQGKALQSEYAELQSQREMSLHERRGEKITQHASELESYRTSYAMHPDVFDMLVDAMGYVQKRHDTKIARLEERIGRNASRRSALAQATIVIQKWYDTRGYRDGVADHWDELQQASLRFAAATEAGATCSPFYADFMESIA